MEPKKPAPRQGCKLSVTTTATNNHEHLAPLTGCGCDATPFYTPATPDGAAGNPSRMARDKPVAPLAPAAVQVAASVKLHGLAPWHRSKLLTQSLLVDEFAVARDDRPGGSSQQTPEGGTTKHHAVVGQRLLDSL